MGAVLVSAANERGQMLSGLRTPGLILFDEIVLGETLAYVETILRSEPSLFVARHQLSLPTRGAVPKSRECLREMATGPRE